MGNFEAMRCALVRVARRHRPHSPKGGTETPEGTETTDTALRGGAPERKRQPRTFDEPRVLSVLARRNSANAVLVILLWQFALACTGEVEPDAYGTFEAVEVVVSSQASGQLRSFSALEGATLAMGAVVGIIDTVQLDFEREVSVAQRSATEARVVAANSQIGVYEAQLGIARRTMERTRRLLDQHAATAQQLDQAERDYRTLVAQIQAARAQRQSVGQEIASSRARVDQIHDRIARSRITNPVGGTVLASYARAGEVVQSGQPLYRIANLDTLILRAYVAERQLASAKLGQRVRVHVDQGGSLLDLTGVIRWVSASAEFTPTPIQTRDKRADLVYAVKVYVSNPNGMLKVGMPGDVDLPSGAAK